MNESVIDILNEKFIGFWLFKFLNYVWMNVLLFCLLLFDFGNKFLFKFCKYIDKCICVEYLNVLRKCCFLLFVYRVFKNKFNSENIGI